MAGLWADVAAGQKHSRQLIDCPVEVMTHPHASEAHHFSELFLIVFLHDERADQVFFLSVEAGDAAIEVGGEDDFIFEAAGFARTDGGTEELGSDDSGQSA